MTPSDDEIVSVSTRADAADNMSIQSARVSTVLQTVSSDQSPSISPHHPDAYLLTLGQRFDCAVIKMLTVDDKIDLESSLTARFTDDVGWLADEIATHQPTTIEGVRVHTRVLKQMYLGGVAQTVTDDPDEHYQRKIVRAFTDALLA